MQVHSAQHVVADDGFLAHKELTKEDLWMLCCPMDGQEILYSNIPFGHGELEVVTPRRLSSRSCFIEALRYGHI